MATTPRFAIAALLAAAGAAQATEITVQNDSLCNGCSGAIQVGFIAGESGAAWLTSPCDGTIVAVQVLWLSLSGGAPVSVEECITIHAQGPFPLPGAPLAVLEAPGMQDGGLNEFRFLDEDMTVPLAVPVTAGEVFVVALTFFNDPSPTNGPSLVTDINGCQTPRNAVFAIPGGWINPCALGMSGDFVIRAVIDCPSALGACCLPDGTCTSAMTEKECTDAEGTFQGEGALCPPSCPQPLGACCFSDPEGCANLTLNQCAVARGQWQGPGTDCGTLVCNPTGACCLPDGSCLDATPEADCLAAGGAFQGDETSCASASCPQPVGGCCLANGACLELVEDTCIDIPGALWAGPSTGCADSNGNGTADDCEPTCPADLNADGIVGITDLLALLGAWGPGPGDPADLDGDGIVGITDLLALLSTWGACP
jgi:hypothetical protein